MSLRHLFGTLQERPSQTAPPSTPLHARYSSRSRDQSHPLLSPYQGQGLRRPQRTKRSPATNLYLQNQTQSNPTSSLQIIQVIMMTTLSTTTMITTEMERARAKKITSRSGHRRRVQIRTRTWTARSGATRRMSRSRIRMTCCFD